MRKRERTSLRDPQGQLRMGLAHAWQQPMGTSSRERQPGASVLGLAAVSHHVMGGDVARCLFALIQLSDVSAVERALCV